MDAAGRSQERIRSSGRKEDWLGSSCSSSDARVSKEQDCGGCWKGVHGARVEKPTTLPEGFLLFPDRMSIFLPVVVGGWIKQPVSIVHDDATACIFV
eukprot:scaffold1671_cov344-Pavlova_lutheri.AAC.51